MIGNLLTYLVLNLFAWAYVTFGVRELFEEYKNDPMPLRIFKAVFYIPLGYLVMLSPFIGFVLIVALINFVMT